MCVLSLIHTKFTFIGIMKDFAVHINNLLVAIEWDVGLFASESKSTFSYVFD